MPRGRKTQPDYPGSLGSLLYDKRKANGWPAKKVADACGLSQTFIAAIERGARCPELDRVPDIASAYGLNISLVCWTWLIQFAPRAAPYMVNPAAADRVSYPDPATAGLLQFADSHAEVTAELQAAFAERRRQRPAAVTPDQGPLPPELLRVDLPQAIPDSPLPEDRSIALCAAAQKAQTQAILDRPMPTGQHFEFEKPTRYTLAGPREPRPPEISRPIHEESVEDQNDAGNTGNDDDRRH